MYLTLLVFCVSIVMVSCKESKEKEEETKSSLAAEKAEMAMNDVFQCPMDCEDGKTYEEEGTCPVCKMDLKKVEHDKEKHDEAHDEHAGHDHD
ncbi:MAG: hypothetical protein KJO41_08380 [Bacteroidia bacterium]|nr:hypothetical protein [Bacteroidia bacterium]RZW52243.1 MAG: hypothetical protein EX263_06930 [Flavobacteriaceae bacterium]